MASTVAASLQLVRPTTMSTYADTASDVTTLELEPVETIGAECQEIGPLFNDWKVGVPKHLDWNESRKRREVKLQRLHVSREVGHAQNRVVSVLTKIGQDFAIRGLEKPQRAEAEHRKQLAQPDQVLHPLEER